MMGLRPTGTNFRRYASKQNRQQLSRDLAIATSTALLERTQAGKDKEPKKEEQEDDHIIMKAPADPSGNRQPIPEECRAVL